MFKNKPLIISILVVVVLGAISILYFKKPAGVEQEYNVTVINNTGEEIKSIGYYEDRESGGVTNADNSLMANGTKVYLDIYSEKFKLSITDKNGNEVISNYLYIDLKNEDKKYEISIQKDEDDKFVFEIN